VQATGHHPVISSAATSWPSDPTSSEWPTSPSCRRWPALSLAVVLDTWSRIIGWAFSADLKTRVALDALDMVLVARKPDIGSGPVLRGLTLTAMDRLVGWHRKATGAA
jgi:transposase InsO family protein